MYYKKEAQTHCGKAEARAAQSPGGAPREHCPSTVSLYSQTSPLYNLAEMLSLFSSVTKEKLTLHLECSKMSKYLNILNKQIKK